MVENGRSRTQEQNVAYEPHTMAGQISAREMGSRVANDAPAPAAQKTPSNDAPAAAHADEAFLQSDLAVEKISYRPKTAQNRANFGRLTTEIWSLIPDEPHSVIVSAADAVLEVLYADCGIVEKRQRIEQLLSTKVPDTQMSALVAHAKSITDYQEEDADGASEAADGIIAVEFEEEGEASPSRGGGAQNGLDANSGLDPASGADNDADDGAEHMEAALGSEVVALREEAAAAFTMGDVTKDVLYARLSALEPDKERAEVVATCKAISRLLSDGGADDRAVEAGVLEILQYQHLAFAKFCVVNRWRVVYGLRALQNRAKTIEELRAGGHGALLQELGVTTKRKRDDNDNDNDSKNDDNNNNDDNSNSNSKIDDDDDDNERRAAAARPTGGARAPQEVDLDALAFEQGPQLMASAKIVLPKGSYQQNKKLYDTISVPAPEGPPALEETGERLVAIAEMPEWARAAFPAGETGTLNRVQSKVYPTAFGTDRNMLVCAPTGAGKTNVAMLAVLRVLGNHRGEDGQLDLQGFKAVYIAPLKALVSEQMREFERRLAAQYGVVVNELTGDSALSQRQIAETQILVTTPEKWDVVTRKAANDVYLRHVRLVVVDEVHLLHDERGPVLESVIVRAKRQPGVRVVALSATLPNYDDVARFIGADAAACFYFDARYRPCPLAQQFVGVKDKKAVLKAAAMNEACGDKVAEARAAGHQVIVFVHSRKDTVKTAQWLAARAAGGDPEGNGSGHNNNNNNNNINNGNNSNNSGNVSDAVSAGSQEILRQEAAARGDSGLAAVLPAGFGVHHAGLNKDDRAVVEDLFAQGHVRVLVSTATLAWGVNLPAHTVIVKGTDTYSAEKGAWVQLSPQDLHQMLGRAGRPRYDQSGEGVIITAHDQLPYYLAVMNAQLPIESQMVRRLADSLNAEIVLGAVADRAGAAAWMAQTYLYVRMLRAPALYQVGACGADTTAGAAADAAADASLAARRADLCHSALALLHRSHMAVYDAVSGAVAPTELGRIAAHFYIDHRSVAHYHQQLRPWMSDMDLVRVFAGSGEFRHMAVRQEEAAEVAALADRCPVPVRGDAAATKVAVLLQAHVSRLRLHGFALVADMIHVTQSAARLWRALHEMCRRRRWAQPARIALDWCKFVERRMWNTQSPWRQLGALAPPALIRAAEASHLPFAALAALDAAQLAEAINYKGSSAAVAPLLAQFPHVDVACQAQPVAPDTVRVCVELTPRWRWNAAVHARAEPLVVVVEDADGERILHDAAVRVSAHNVNRTLFLDFAVPAPAPPAPAMFVSVASERWLHPPWRVPVPMYAVPPPRAPHAPTAVADVQSVPVAAAAPFAAVFPFAYFNKLQSQCFHAVFRTNASVLVGAAAGTGKTALAELAILHAWRQNRQRVVYLQPQPELVLRLAARWARVLAPLTDPPKAVACLTGDLPRDARILARTHLVLATPAQFDAVSRRWRHRKAVQALDVVVADDVHLVGGAAGAAYEASLTRVRTMAAALERDVRVVALSAPLLYGRELGEWLGCAKHNVLNFAAGARAAPVEIALRPYAGAAVDAAAEHADAAAAAAAALAPAVVFVASRAAAQALVPAMAAVGEAHAAAAAPALDKVQDAALRASLRRGVALYHEHLCAGDRAVVERLVAADCVRVVVATRATAAYAPRARGVVVLGTQAADVFQHTDYLVGDVLSMVGCARERVVAYVHEGKVAQYRQFLADGLPVESTVHAALADVLVHEFAAQTCRTKQDCLDWLTHSYLYRRVAQNPGFYGVTDASHVGLSEHLSEMIEEAVEELQAAQLVEIADGGDENANANEDEDEEEEEEVVPLNGAMIASYYSVAVASMRRLAALTAKARVRHLVECVTGGAEFDDLPVRAGDDRAVERLAAQVPLAPAADADWASPHVKAFVLLQAHMSRVPLAAELARDAAHVAETSLRLVSAAVDVLASEGWLNALQAMDLAQSIVQGMWLRDSPLLQLPHVSGAMLERCGRHGVETVYDLMALDDADRDDVLRLDGARLQRVADFVNQYPNIDVRYELAGAVVAGRSHAVTVVLERDEDAASLDVVSARFDAPRSEAWWVVVGDAHTRQLYAVKKTAVASVSQRVTVDFVVPTPGVHHLTIWCMCDSYVDADKEMAMDVDVAEAADEAAEASDSGEADGQ